ncbi:MAG: hypothetical protein P8H56_12680 [Crocinitomicaceae bacterium]|nr:hypothetical protein [Crocinitomicaceae bacterium]MDG1659427.1 hypothetical protein [Crocinitomicaceae bacterium]
MITLIFMILGGIIGSIIYLNRSDVAIWYVVYQFNEEETDNLPEVAKVDTLFLKNDVLLRNYTSSSRDEEQPRGFKRHELKIYVGGEVSEEDVASIAQKLFDDHEISVFDTVFKEKQRKKRIILDMLLLGLVIGIVIQFIRSLKKNPSSDN